MRYLCTCLFLCVFCLVSWILEEQEIMGEYVTLEMIHIEVFCEKGLLSFTRLNWAISALLHLAVFLPSDWKVPSSCSFQQLHRRCSAVLQLSPHLLFVHGENMQEQVPEILTHCQPALSFAVKTVSVPRGNSQGSGCKNLYFCDWNLNLTKL